MSAPKGGKSPGSGRTHGALNKDTAHFNNMFEMYLEKRREKDPGHTISPVEFLIDTYHDPKVDMVHKLRAIHEILTYSWVKPTQTIEIKAPVQSTFQWANDDQDENGRVDPLSLLKDSPVLLEQSLPIESAKV